MLKPLKTWKVHYFSLCVLSLSLSRSRLLFHFVALHILFTFVLFYSILLCSLHVSHKNIHFLLPLMPFVRQFRRSQFYILFRHFILVTFKILMHSILLACLFVGWLAGWLVVWLAFSQVCWIVSIHAANTDELLPIRHFLSYCKQVAVYKIIPSHFMVSVSFPFITQIFALTAENYNQNSRSKRKYA